MRPAATTSEVHSIKVSAAIYKNTITIKPNETEYSISFTYDSSYDCTVSSFLCSTEDKDPTSIVK